MKNTVGTVLVIIAVIAFIAVDFMLRGGGDGPTSVFFAN